MNELVAAVCIGVACALLSPHEPASAFATVLLIVAWKLISQVGDT